MRELWTTPPPLAATWRASAYRLDGDRLRPEYIAAVDRAVWSRSNPFQFYRPVRPRSSEDVAAPHGPFARLADLSRDFTPPERAPENAKRLHQRIKVFAATYGLLGLFGEEFASPSLPERKTNPLVFVAPDAAMDDEGRLCEIDPATEGKERLEELLRERDKRIYEERRELHLWEPEKYALTTEVLILPAELSFRRTRADVMSAGLSRPLFGREKPRTATYEDVRREYGVHVLFDRGAPKGVSLISTREPVAAWVSRLRGFFPSSPSPEYLDRHLEGVRPRAVTGEDGRPARSWYCPSLHKAIYLMTYLDKTDDVELRKCHRPGCPSYFRAPYHDERSKYCSPKCASIVSSAMYRERQRKSRNPDTT